MDDDFNTGGAIGDLFELVRLLNRYADAEKLDTAAGKADAAKVAVLKRGAAVMREIAGTVGLFRSPAAKPGTEGGNDELVGKLMQLFLEVRADARKNKNFATADGIRKGLAAIGIILEDRPDGTTWSIQK
jgi:cysteinyl-tRNA synthetase